MNSSTHHHPGSGEPDRNGENPYAILVLPVNSSFAWLSSFPPTSGHRSRPSARDPFTRPYLGVSKSVNLPTSISSEFGSTRWGGPIPAVFLTYHMPVSAMKYVPTIKALGYKGENGWVTGGLVAGWEGDALRGREEVKKELEMERKGVEVIKLGTWKEGWKEEIAITEPKIRERFTYIARPMLMETSLKSDEIQKGRNEHAESTSIARNIQAKRTLRDQ